MLILPPPPGCSRAAVLQSGITLKVAPASLKDQQRAEADGIMKILEEAGAEFLAMPVASVLATVKTGLLRIRSAFLRLHAISKAAWGRPVQRAYLASPYTVAASAVTGQLTDPRLVVEG